MIDSEFYCALLAMVLTISDPHVIAYWVTVGVHQVRAPHPAANPDRSAAAKSLNRTL